NPSPEAPKGGHDEAAFGDPQLEAQLTQHFASDAAATGVDLSALAARVASLSAEELPSRVYRPRVRRFAPLQAAALVAMGLVGLRLLGPSPTPATLDSGVLVASPIDLPATVLADVDLLTRDMVARERAISNLSGVADFECELESLFPEAEFRCDS
ncbi:MAG: hypothetical protein VYB14_04965, partial [Planctomycetota bacterium]|nr:hypothetical protein [Planctomycetota bacterium]